MSKAPIRGCYWYDHIIVKEHLPRTSPPRISQADQTRASSGCASGGFLRPTEIVYGASISPLLPRRDRSAPLFPPQMSVQGNTPRSKEKYPQQYLASIVPLWTQKEKPEFNGGLQSKDFIGCPKKN